MNLTLLSHISLAVASTKDTTVLLKTIIDELRPVFDFYDVGLFVVNEAEDYHIDLVAETPEISPSEWNYSLFGQQIHKIPHQDSVTAWMIQQITAAGQPLLFDFQDLIIRFPDYPQWAAMQPFVYRDCLVTALRVRGETIGMFCLNSLQKDHFSPEQFPLFQAIADQVAITLSNILTQEEILAQKQRVEQLLTISEAITQIKDRKQLLKTIYERIRPILPYDSYGLFVLTEDGQQHYELIDAEMMDHDPVQVAVEQQYGAHARYPHSGSEVEIMMQRGPDLFRVNDFGKDPMIPLMREGGLRQLIGGPLTYGGEAIGMLSFNSKQENYYTEQHLPLFTAIAEQMSVAVSNVLANEAVLAEKAKVERLHLVSEVMASIQQRDQLSLAFDRIRSVFPFDNAGLFVLTEDEQQHYELLDSDTLGQDPTQRRIEARFGKHARYAHADSPVEWMMQHEGVGIYDFMNLLHRFPDYPQAELMRETNLCQIIAAPLQQGNEVIGLLNFNSEQVDQYSEADFPFFQAIAEQMSTVVSNVLANEQLLEEKQFKETLLEISEVATQIRDREGLYQAVMDKLKPLIKFDDAVLILLSEDRRQYTHALVSNANLASQHQYFDHVMHNAFPIKSSPVEDILNGEKVNTFKIDAWLKKHPDHLGLLMVKSIGEAYTISLLLREGEITYAALLFHFTEKPLFDDKVKELYANIADQMSVVMSNVLANEDIRRREQDKHLQLQVIHTLNQEHDWPDKLQRIIRLLHVHLDIHLVLFAIHFAGRDNYCYAFERIGADEYRTFDYPSFLRFTGMSEAEYHQPGAAYDQLVLATGEEFEELTRENPAMRTTADCFGVRSWLHLPLHIGMAGQFRLGILSKQAHAYGESDLRQLRILQPSLELALGRSLAFEQVAQLNKELLQEKHYLQEEIKTTYNFEQIIGQGNAMQAVFRNVRQVAPTDSNVLIQGETGTGKELIARAIHSLSSRREKALIKVNCAALPEHLIESELFGHVKGAFTGAVQSRIGKFELADKGTIFLDEIGELPLSLQSKLLRVLQEREFEKLGSNQLIRSDFRVIAATNRSLEEEADRGAFRLDLFYRLNSFPLKIPPLRERREDIPLLADHFARLYTQKLDKPFRGFTTASQDHFRQYAWPGNVRQLQNVIEQASIVAQTPLLDITAQTNPSTVSRPLNGEVHPNTVDMNYIKAQQDALERQYILDVLEKTHWKVSGEGGAAAQLKLKPTTLEYRMKKLGIER